MQSRRFSGLPVIGVLTLVYFIAGKFGLMLASLQASASPVWPAAGIALAALLVLGYRAWPAIFVGAFLVNVITAGNVATSLAIASGNTLEAVCGAWLVNRFAGGATAFDHPEGVFKFALAAVVSTIISPAFGVSSLALAGFANWMNYGEIWLTWWLGDTTGDLLIAPLIILWSIASKRRWNRSEAIEAGILLLLLFVLSVAVFCGWLTISAGNYPIAFICGSLVIWTAFRFTQRETATSILILSAIAIWGTIHNFGPFVSETENQSLLALQSWTAVLAITAMALSAGMAERGRAAEALRESEASMSLAANAANLGLWVWNIPGGEERWVTEKWRQLFGFADSEPVTFDRFLEVVHPGDSERVKQVVQHMLEHGGEYEIEYRITRPDGSIRWIATHGRVELDERGKPVLARGVSRDVTKRKTAEEDEGRRREQVELLGRVSLLGEMTASLAHELNQPLTAIVNNATAAMQYLEQGKLDPEQLQEILTEVVGDSRRAHDIMHNVRSAIKKGSAIRGRINLNDVVKAVTHMVHLDAAAHFCKVEMSLAQNLPAIEGDPSQIQQVLINLVRNAFDAMRGTPPSGRKVEIATNYNGDGTICVAVRDYGSGIPEPTLERLFEQFFTTKEEGLGMGLTIVRSIVEAHGGSIVAENADGGGARFRFRLPTKEGMPQ